MSDRHARAHVFQRNIKETKADAHTGHSGRPSRTRIVSGVADIGHAPATQACRRFKQEVGFGLAATGAKRIAAKDRRKTRCQPQCVEQLACKIFKLVGHQREFDAVVVQCLQHLQSAGKQAGVHCDVRFIIGQKIAMHGGCISPVSAAGCRQSAFEHHPCAAADKIGNLIDRDFAPPGTSQRMVERHAEIAAGIQQRAIEIKTDDIKRKLCHRLCPCLPVVETASVCWQRHTMTDTASARPLAAIILAAGKGTRMKSDLHKVLHRIAGRPMIDHLMASVSALAPERQVVVVGSGRDQLEAALGGRADIAVQDPQLGTGHAVQQAQAGLAGFTGDVLILYGDVPFVSTETMRSMLNRLNAADAPAVVVLGFTPDDALQYGRVITEGDRIAKMVEFKDATEAERACRLCNSGLMAARSEDLFALLARVGNDNAQGEYYLPDIVNIAQADGRTCAVVVTPDAHEVAGINSRGELAEAEGLWQQRRRAQAMADGATLIAPETVWFAWDTVLGRDVLIEPNVVFGPGVSVSDGSTIRAFSHLEGATLGTGVEVGPYARLRPGAVLEEKAKVGNFVEVKKAVLGKGAKANHLSYIGDAEVGAGANIGAGTITCNYDGYFKYKTVIGERAFIGSNSALVAPVKIGADAIVAAGSAVTRDVAEGELRLVRAEQMVKPGWADRFHDTMRKRKAEAKKG